MYKARAIKNAQVLIVDDEPNIVDFIKSTLSKNGYAIEAYTDPLEALKNIRGKVYDLALVDIYMPEMTGIEFSRKVLETSLSTEIVIITGVPDEQNLDPCLRMGITHFLFKPFNDSQLVYRYTPLSTSNGYGMPLLPPLRMKEKGVGMSVSPCPPGMSVMRSPRLQIWTYQC